MPQRGHPLVKNMALKCWFTLESTSAVVLYTDHHRAAQEKLKYTIYYNYSKS